MPTAAEIDLLREDLERVKSHINRLEETKQEVISDLEDIGINTELKATLRIKTNNRKIGKLEQKLSDLLDEAEDKLLSMVRDDS